MSSPHEESAAGDGVSDLRARRERLRKPPPPRNPVGGGTPATETNRETTHEISHETAAGTAARSHLKAVPPVAPKQAPKPAVKKAAEPGQVVPKVTVTPVATESPDEPIPMPKLDVDPRDPAGRIPSPTTMSMWAGIMRRFEQERVDAKSHAALMLKAMQTVADDLPEHVLVRRGGPAVGSLFPWRGGGTEPKFKDEAMADPAMQRLEPLRVRPTVPEMAVIDALVEWVNAEIERRWPAMAPAKRSEVVRAALEEYLPPLKAAKKK